MEFTKLDENTLEVIKQEPQPEPVKVTYERAFIEKQIESITTQRDEMILLKQKELDECLLILKSMDELNIVVKPVEPIKELTK